MSTVAAVFEVADATSGEEMRRFLALLDDLREWTFQGLIVDHDSAQTALGRRSGEGFLMRVVGTPEGIEALHFRLGKPLLVAETVCDRCFVAPADTEVEDDYEGSLHRLRLCARCAGDGHGEDMAALERSLIAPVVDHWVNVALRTQPADRPAGEAALRAAYASAGRPPPPVVWLESPFAAAVVSSTIEGIRGRRIPRPVEPIADPALVDLAQRAGRHLAGASALQARDDVDAEVRPTVPPLVWQRVEIDVRRRVWRLVDDRLHGALGDELGQLDRLVVQDDDDGDGDGLAARSWAAAVDQLQRQTKWFRPADFDWPRVRDKVWKGPDGGRRMVGVTSAADRTDWLAKVDFLLRSGRLRAPSPTFAALRHVAEAGGRWWAFEHLAILTERPVAIRHDDAARPHCTTGPAIQYPDGFAVYAWHGDRVPSRVVTRPEAITAHDIDAERDPRVRLAMVECSGGWKRYLAACGAEVVQSDACGTLWRGHPAAAGEPWLLLEMQSPTAGSDGTRKRSVLRVPPSVQTAREAVAWTFAVSEDAYTPLAET